MGWWGFGVTDGDTPSDITFDLQLAVGIPDREEAGDVEYLADRELLRAFDWATAVPPIVEQWDGSAYESDGIVWQCLAMLYLEYQLDVPDGVKEKATEACVNQVDEADHFSEPDARIAALNAFVKAVAASDRGGLTCSGLFWSAELEPRKLFD